MLAEDIAPEILQFASERQILPYVLRALALARECFPPLAALSFEAMTDPESDDEWLSIRVRIHADPRVALDAYNRYTQRWVEEAPWPAVNTIVLSPDIG